MGRRQRIARSEGVLLELIQEVQQRRLDGAAMSPWELPTVVACRRVIADTVMQLRLEAVKGDVPTADQPALFRRPNPLEPYWLTMHKLVNHLSGWGHSWLLPTAYDAAGYPLAARVVDPAQGAATFTTSGDLAEVYIDGNRYRPGVDGVIWVPYDVPRPGSPGVSPIAGCWRAIEYLTALYDMAGSFWEAGFPSIAVTVQQSLSPTQSLELKDQLRAAWSRRHEPAVMDKGATLNSVGSSAVESQLVESMAMANAEIARAFGVMPSLVNVAGGDSLTYSTTAGEFNKWKIVGLGPYLTRIESAFTDCRPWGTDARFETSNLTRADESARAAYLTSALAGAPWMTVDEARRRYESLGPLDPAALATAPPVQRLEVATA